MPAHEIAFKKEDHDKRLVWAEVYAPDRPDADGEFMRADEIEKMAYAFMKSMKMDAVDTHHSQENEEGCCVIESFIARKGDPDFIEGAWVVGIHVDRDDIWEKVDKGELNGFSMEAWVKREEKDVELEVPPVLTGMTMKSEDHEHEFMVAYNDDGLFLGGRTNEVNGHSHLILRGTVTQTADGHSHRFAHVELLKIK